MMKEKNLFVTDQEESKPREGGVSIPPSTVTNQKFQKAHSESPWQRKEENKQ